MATYTLFSPAKPSGASTGPTFATDANTNDIALWYAVVAGIAPGFALSITGGTNEEPSRFLWTNGTTVIFVDNTWSGGRITSQNWYCSQDGLQTWVAIGTNPVTFTYDGSGNLTASSNGGGFVALLNYVVGKVKALKTAYDAHAAATGTSVHGLGSMSTQASTAVSVTGGTITGVNLEYNYARGKIVNLGNITGSVAVDWNAGDYFYGTVTGVTTLSWSNLPNAKAGSVTLELTNPGAFTLTWPGGVLWPGGLAPSRTASGVDLYEFVCRDGSTVRGAQAQKASA